MNCTYTYKGKTYSTDRLLRTLVEELPVNDQVESIRFLTEFLGMSENDIIIIKGLIENKSLGRFKADGQILLSQHATIDVAYHEAFHRVWRLYLSSKERTEAIQEIKKRKNYQQIINNYKTIYPNLSESELVEEFLADEFSDYTVNRQYKIETPIKSFFERLIRFIRNLLGLRPTNVQLIYDKILSKSYKTANKSAQQYLKDADKILVNGEEITIEEKYELIQKLTQEFVKAMFMLNGDIDLFLKSPSVKIKNLIQEHIIPNVLSHISDTVENSDDLVVALYNDVDSWANGKESILMPGVINNLKLLGLNFSDSEDSTEGALDDEEKQAREFTASVEVDPKSKIGKKIKLLLSSLTETSTTSNFHFQKPVSWTKAFTQIGTRMAGIPTSRFMEELANLDLPYVSQLIDMLNTNFNFRNEFISTMAMTENKFYIVQHRKGDIYFYDANSGTRVDNISSRWKNKLLRKIQNWDEWIEETRRLDRNKASISNQEILEHFGIDLSTNLENISDSVHLLLMKAASVKTKPNKDIFQELNIGGYIKTLAQKQAAYEDQVDSMINLGGTKLYSLGLNTQQTTIINNIRYAQSKFTSDMTQSEKIEILKEFVPFQVSEFNVTKLDSGEYIIHNKWLEKILSGESLDLVIPYLIQTEQGEAEEISKLDEADLMSMHINGALQGHYMSMKHADRSTFFAYKFEKPLISKGDTPTVERTLDFLVDEIVEQIRIELKLIDQLKEKGSSVQYLGKAYDKLAFGSLVTKEELEKISKGELSRIQSIENLVNEKFAEFKRFADELGITQEYTSRIYVDEKSINVKRIKGINNSLIAEYGSLDLTLAAAFVNEVVNHIHELRFFSGDIRAFKNGNDLFKRLAPQSSSGKLSVNDDATHEHIRQELNQEFEIVNPKTGEVEKVNPADKIGFGKDKFFRSVTGVERENYKSQLLDLATTPSGKPIISKFTGKQESKLFILYENEFIRDFPGKPLEELKKLYEPKIRLYEEKYSAANENDGQSYMTLPAFKKFMIRQGSWTDGMELVYQIEMKIASLKRSENIADIEIEFKGVKFKPFEIKPQEINGRKFDGWKKRVEGNKLVSLDSVHTLKTQFGGYSVPEQYYDDVQGAVNLMFNSVYKTSQHLLVPSAIIGTNLQLMNFSLLKNGVDIYHMGSANKVGGIDSKLAAQTIIKTRNTDNVDIRSNNDYIDDIAERGLDFYDKDGYFNHEALTANMDVVSYLSDWDYLKDQVKIGNKVKTEIKGSTQSLKILLSNLMIDGRERFAGAKQLIDDYKKVINDMVKTNQKSLLERIGYSLDENRFTSLDHLKKTILESTQVKSAPEGIRNAIENFFDDIDLGLESVPMKNKIENVLYSLITNGIISFDRPGTTYPQAAVTGYEKLGSRKFKYKTFKQVVSENIENGEKRLNDLSDPLAENLGELGLGFKYFEEVELPIESIKPPAKTASDNEYDYLKEDIKNGQKTPVLLNDRDELIEGRHRYYSLLAAGEKTIKVYRPAKGVKENIQTSNQDTLKFYNPIFDDEGNIIKMEPAEIIIPLPDHWIKPLLRWAKTNNLVKAVEKLNADISKRPELYQVKALRIPNQQLSSNDIFQIKKFNIPTFQNYVIVPTELVIKTGGDFDIDKENIYWSSNIESRIFDELTDFEILDRYDNYVSLLEELGETPMSFDNYIKHFKLKLEQNDDEKLLDLEKQLLLHPRNVHHLLMPLTDEIYVKDIYTKLDKLGVIDTPKKDIISAFLPSTNVKNTVIFVKGKFGVGVVALGITNQSTNQVDQVRLNTIYNDQSGDKKSTKLLFEDLDQKFDLQNYVDNKGTFLSEIQSQLLTTQVDNVKNPTAVLMNINMQTLNVKDYLIRRGVNPETIILFLNQPLIKKYLFNQKINESYANKNANSDADKTELRKEDLIKKTLSEANLSLDLYMNAQKNEPKLFGDEELLSNILDSKFDERQVDALVYFLNLQDQAAAFGDYQTTQNSDTKGLKDKQGLDEFLLAQGRVQMSDLIPQDVRDNVNLNGVISPFYIYGRRSYNIFNPFYAFEKTIFGGKLLQFKDEASLSAKSSDKDKVRQTIDNDFLLFLIHNFVTTKAEFNRLMKGPDSVAKRIQDLKVQIPNNLVLKAFLPMLNTSVDRTDNQKIDSLRLFEKDLNQLDSSDLKSSLEEISEIDYELYKDIIKLLMFQSGFNISPFNYRNIVPVGLNRSRNEFNVHEYVYQDLIKEAIEKFQNNENLKTDVGATQFMEQFKMLFALNNIKFLRKHTPYLFKNETYPYHVGKYWSREYNEFRIKSVKGNSEFIPLGDGYQKQYFISLLNIVPPKPKVTNEKSDDFFDSLLNRETQVSAKEESISSQGNVDKDSSKTLPEKQSNVQLPKNNNSEVKTLPMQPDNIEKIKSGTKTITNRTGKFEDGVYRLPDGTLVEVIYLGEVKVKEQSDDIAIVKDGFIIERGLYTKDQFAQAEGFKSWKDFEETNKFSKNFIKGNESRFVYSIKSNQQDISKKPITPNVETKLTENKPKNLSKYELFPGVFANEGQTEALDLLTDFLNSNEQEFVLMGRGGTGKTTIIKKIVEEYKKQGRQVLGIAVAHKAKKVLGKSIGNHSVKTIASALAIKLNEQTGEFTPDVYLRKTGKLPIKGKDLIIVDEASMVSDEMHKELMQLKESGAKIIYMGDPAQLPPVGSEKNSSTFDVKNQYTLREKMRQAATSPILNVGTEVADNIESANPKLVAIQDRTSRYDDVSKSQTIFTDNENFVIDSIVADIKNANNNPDYVKAVTFNNESHNSQQSVKTLNQKIRAKLWGAQAKNQFNVGELVTAYASYSPDPKASEDQIQVHNADDFVVVSQFSSRESGSVSVFSQDKGQRSFNFAYEVVRLTLQDNLGSIVNYSVPVVAESSKAQYDKDLAKLWNTDKQLAFALTNYFANIQYGYAITSHKAQGSTYTNVYVFEDNILGPSNGGSILSKNKSLYVAVSRPTTKLVVLSSKNSERSEIESEDWFANTNTNEPVDLSDMSLWQSLDDSPGITETLDNC